MKKISQLFILIMTLSWPVCKAQSIQGKLDIINIDAHNFPEISVSIKAERKNAIPVWDLDKSKIQIEEGGKKCEVKSIQPLAKFNPVYVSMVVDHSGSMEEDHAQLYDKEGKPLFTIDKDDNMVVPDTYTSPIDNAKAAIKEFTSSFDAKKDFISITGFGSTVDKPLTLTQDEKTINAYVDAMQPVGKTALYDGVIAGIEQLKKINGIKVLVVLTDGEDNRSKSSLEDVISKAESANTQIFVIGLGDVNKSNLEQIANSTNGEFFYTNSSSSLDYIYGKISKMVQATYSISYITSNTDVNTKTREAFVSALIKNNYSISDKESYTIDEVKKSVAAPVVINNDHPSNPLTGTTKATSKVNLPKLQINQAAAVNHNEMNMLWIYGNIILAGLAAMFLLVFKKRRAQRRVQQVS